MGKSSVLNWPGSDKYFYTDKNGTINLNIGRLAYNSEAQKADDFFKIYVNNELKDKIISTGTNQTRFYEIELMNS